MVTNKAKKHICMIACTDYLGDGRVRREAESLAATGKYDVRVIALKRGPRPDSYAVDNVTVMEMNQAKYRRNRFDIARAIVLFRSEIRGPCKT